MDAEFIKLIGGITLTSGLAIATVVLWRAYQAAQAKYEAMVERYHVTLTQMTVALTSVTEHLEEMDKEGK